MRSQKVGILGGGQLGMLLVQKAMELPITVKVLDPNPEASVANFVHDFIVGDLLDYETVLNFGQDCDIITFEIETVNTEALLQLKSQGKQVHPDPEVLKTIQDKGLQREFLEKHGFPQTKYQLLDEDAVKNYTGPFPIVQKLRTGGYDGKGVQIIKSTEDKNKILPGTSVFEELVEIQSELSILAARNPNGEIAVFPPIELIFHPEANLVDTLIAPARIADNQTTKAIELTKKLAEKLNIVGVFAVEMFIDKNSEVLINEISPRPHNSGHHTVFANVCSQYEQHLRAILNLPLGSTELLTPAVLINLLGDKNANGKTDYQGLVEAYKIPEAKLVFYGKSTVKPYRKMGHAVLIDKTIDQALKKADILRKTLTITNQ